MEKIILVRHGSCDTATRSLSEIGEKQMRNIAGKIGPSVAPGAALLSSSAPHARRSAEILKKLADNITVTFYSPLFWSDEREGRRPDHQVAMKTLLSYENAKTVIVVTDLECIGELTSAICSKFGILLSDLGYLANGEALLLGISGYYTMFSQREN